ncbi:MAG: flavin reductase family protein [Oscillospiraceae bacterium]|nr:flavin reductase family protein [Oscillospiraceae bacterium]
MRKNFGAKPMVYPMPVFILAAYDENGVPDAMNAAWGGICGSDEICMAISPNHKTTKNFLATGAFTVSMADAEHVVACDYVGVESANKVPDKFEKAGFHATKSEFVNAPIIDELPMALECEVKSYDPESHILIGKIINICADEKILNENGKIDPAKLRPITFDAANSKYIALGEIVGNAFSDGNALK